MVWLFDFGVDHVFWSELTLIEIICDKDGLISKISPLDSVFVDLFYLFLWSPLVRLVQIGACWVYFYRGWMISIDISAVNFNFYWLIRC